MRHHPDELENLLPTGDEARAQHVAHAEGLGGRGGRRGRVVRGIRELLPQLQVVQNEPVAVIGYAQAVRGLAIGGSGKVGADPGRQPCASVRALGQQRPVQRAQRGVNPVEVAATVRREETVGQADLVDGEPGVALQVQGLSQVYLRLFEAPLRCYWGLIRKTVPPFCRIRVSAKMGGLPSSTGQLPSAADGSRIDAAPTAREKSSHLTGCPPGIMGEEGK